MENKLTAVDFLKDKFIMIQWLLVRDEISRKQADEFLNEWYDKAKEIEKEQIEKAFQHSIVAMVVGKVLSPEEYYNETYGK
jgi:hypothetical protein